MKITELRQLILKNQQSLQKPKYIVLTNDDYSELKEEVSDVCIFFDIKTGSHEMRFNDIQIIAESEMLDLRVMVCTHQCTYTSNTDLYGVRTFCSACSQELS